MNEITQITVLFISNLYTRLKKTLLSPAKCERWGDSLLRREKRKRKRAKSGKCEENRKWRKNGVRGTTCPRSFLFHSLQSLICLPSSAKEASVEERWRDIISMRRTSCFVLLFFFAREKYVNFKP